MEHVPGVVLTHYCRNHKLSIEGRLALFMQICDGVQHAHMKGILHRDLKPANILVREIDGRPLAKIIDFGLAQPTDPIQIRATLHEAVHSIVGTIAYMSPEQAERVEGDLDTRTDVYSLGVVLYELLTGQLPITADEIKHHGLFEVGGMLRDYEPRKPSTRLSQLGEQLSPLAAERSVSPARLCSRVRGELDWVTMKAIASERNRRYGSVRDLGRDVERFLQNRPVEAGPPSRLYVARKWLQRHAAGAAVAATLALGAVAFSFVTSSLAAEARAAETRRELGSKGLLVGEYLRRAEDELWPADEHRVGALEAWLRETAPYLALDAELAAYEDELRVELEQGTDDVAREVAASQLRILTTGRGHCAALASMRARVGARLERARALRQRTIVAHAARWQLARTELAADPRFDGFGLPDLSGLVPLGKNPRTGLQEFYVFESGVGSLPDESNHDYDVDADTGVILALIPGGEFAFGEDGEIVRKVGPFLISRYEMTQAQWARLVTEATDDPVRAAAGNPSRPFEFVQTTAGNPGMLGDDVALRALGLDAPFWSHPVQQVSWRRARALLPRWGLRLPTAAQWMWAANGKAEREFTQAWIGEATGRFVNFRDEFARSYWNATDPPSGPESASWDGFVFTCPVDAKAANGFGLVNAIGNVAELVRDGYAPQPMATTAGPEQFTVGAEQAGRALAYGGHFNTVWDVDTMTRQLPLGNAYSEVGLRPVFPLPGGR